MQEGAGIEPMQKYNGKIIHIIYEGAFNLGQFLHKNEFPIAVVEGKAVFREEKVLVELPLSVVETCAEGKINPAREQITAACIKALEQK